MTTADWLVYALAVQQVGIAGAYAYFGDPVRGVYWLACSVIIVASVHMS